MERVFSTPTFTYTASPDGTATFEVGKFKAEFNQEWTAEFTSAFDECFGQRHFSRSVTEGGRSVKVHREECQATSAFNPQYDTTTNGDIYFYPSYGQVYIVEFTGKGWDASAVIPLEAAWLFRRWLVTLTKTNTPDTHTNDSF